MGLVRLEILVVFRSLQSAAAAAGARIELRASLATPVKPSFSSRHCRRFCVVGALSSATFFAVRRRSTVTFFFSVIFVWAAISFESFRR
jgi:hypothetical protein